MLEDADLTVLTEVDLADLKAGEGRRVIARAGRYWVSTFPGFYQPIHLLAQFPAGQVKRPARLCWGYRAAIAPTEALSANGSIPVHLLSDIRQFDPKLMGESRRRDLRRARKAVVYVRVRDAALMVEQGYAVFSSAQRRVPYWPDMTEAAYRRLIAAKAVDPRRLIIAGLVDGRLGGYLESFAIDGTLYAHELFVATEAMRTGIGTGLYVETIQTGIRAGTIHQACLGLHTPERPGLTWFKESLGFPVVQVPARTSIPIPIAAYIRARRPPVHYRLMGMRPDPVAS